MLEHKQKKNTNKKWGSLPKEWEKITKIDHRWTYQRQSGVELLIERKRETLFDATLSLICSPMVYLSYFLVFILIYPQWFLLYPFKKSVGFVSFFSPMQHSHVHTVFKHYHGQDGMLEKRKFVQCHHWLIDWLIDWLILLEAQQAKNAYLQGIPNTNIKGD